MVAVPNRVSPTLPFVTICVGHFISHFWTITLPPLFFVLASEFGVSFLQLGLIITTINVTNALFQMPCGFIVDRKGPKPLLVAGLLVSGIAFCLYPFAPNYLALILLAIPVGMGQAVFHPSNYAFISALFPKERAGRPYSFHTFSGFAGSATAPILIATLNHAFGWQIALGFAGLLGVVLSLFVWRLPLPEPDRRAPSRKPTEQSQSGPGSFMSIALATLFVFFIFTSMFSSGLNSFLPSALIARYPITTGTANAVLTAYLATLAFGVLLGGILADRVRNYSRVIGITFGAGTLLMLIIAVSPMPFWLLFLMFALAGGLQGIIMPSRDKLVRESAPQGATGKSFAFVSVGMNLGGLIGLPLLGSLIDRGDPQLVFWAFAAFMFLAALTVLVPVRGSTRTVETSLATERSGGS